MLPDGCGIGDRHGEEEKLVEWARAYNMIIQNTWFQQHPRTLWTWRCPGNKFCNQSDHILINHRFQTILVQAKISPGADCYSYHMPVNEILRLKLKKLKRTPWNTKIDFANQEMSNRYMITVQNRYNAVEMSSSKDEQRQMASTHETDDKGIQKVVRDFSNSIQRSEVPGDWLHGHV